MSIHWSQTLKWNWWNSCQSLFLICYVLMLSYFIFYLIIYLFHVWWQSAFKSCITDMLRTLQLIGTPTETDLGFLNENAKRYIRQLPLYHRQSLLEKFPHVHPEAIDLVEKMLTFDPRQRITGKFSLPETVMVKDIIISIGALHNFCAFQHHEYLLKVTYWNHQSWVDNLHLSCNNCFYFCFRDVIFVLIYILYILQKL